METKPISIWKLGDLNDYNFQWQHFPYAERVYWNYLLQRVVETDTKADLTSNDYLLDNRVFPDPAQNPALTDESVKESCPNFYNQDFCLALTLCQDGVTTAAPDVTEADTKPKKPVDPPQGLSGMINRTVALPQRACWDFGADSAADLYPYLVKPHFNYHRRNFQRFISNGSNGSSTPPDTMLGYNLHSLTVGSLVWLYFYERMGIFKILGVLLDDYNYRGKYSLSSQVRNGLLKNKQYVELLEHLSTLSRQGLASTLRDRVSTYQRVLGVTVENDLNVQSSENTPFMKNFSKLISNMLEYYNAKRLAVAIQNNTQAPSSVATQTAILNTMKALCQNLEVMEYGRNMVHTFQGIATVYVTLSLIRQIRDVIGIPREYDTPEEYIPAAYDILVLKKQGSPSDTNRYTVFDNCASYGYRILADVQSFNPGGIRLGNMNTEFDAWLSNIEEWVEGYNNAFKSIPNKTSSENAIVMA